MGYAQQQVPYDWELLRKAMTAMVSCVLFSVSSLLYATLIPAVSAYYCKEYTDYNGNYHYAQSCSLSFCCGSCDERYCCSDIGYRLSPEEQSHCSQSFHSTLKTFGNSKIKKTMYIVGIIIGSILPILFCVGLVVCCVAPCCCLYKKCRQRGDATNTNTTVISTPLQPPTVLTSPQSYPGYQPVPGQPNYGTQNYPMGYGGQPLPAAPPPAYGDIIGPGSSPAPLPYSQALFTPGQPMYPLHPPGQPNMPPVPDSAYLPQPAYNPSYTGEG